MTSKIPGWTHIILEGYCGRKWSSKKDKYVYEQNKDGTLTKIKNENYDPNYRTPRKPSYCKNRVSYTCLEKNCPHFGYTDAEKGAYLFLNKFYKKK